MAGTEEGITRPVATFSACFGEPFLVMHPTVYAKMLAERLEEHSCTAWLLNTGWVGGAEFGQRCPLKYTRAIVNAIHDGSLKRASFSTDRTFGLSFPTKCWGVPDGLLNPASSWKDQAAFERTSQELAGLFRKNFVKYSDQCSDDVRAQCPGARQQ